MSGDCWQEMHSHAITNMQLLHGQHMEVVSLSCSWTVGLCWPREVCIASSTKTPLAGVLHRQQAARPKTMYAAVLRKALLYSSTCSAQTPPAVLHAQVHGKPTLGRHGCCRHCYPQHPRYAGPTPSSVFGFGTPEQTAALPDVYCICS